MPHEPPAVGFIRLPHGTDLPLPAYESSLAAGMDLRAARAMTIVPGERALVDTGLVAEIPRGYEGQVRPRSGLALKHGVTCLNTPGTIDADYRGELRVLLINHGSEPFRIEPGMRIAQLVIAPVAQAEVEWRAKVSETERGAAGFGSTGA